MISAFCNSLVSGGELPHEGCIKYIEALFGKGKIAYVY